MSMTGTFEQADNFVVMAHIGELICEIADSDLQFKLMKAIFAYGTFGKDTKFEGEAERCLWKLIKKTIDDTKSRRAKKLNAESTEKKPRGRQRKAVEAVAEVAETESAADVKELAQEASNDSETKPQIDEVVNYCTTQALSVDPFVFYSFYEQKGWKTKAGEKITDWKAMCERWNKPKIGFQSQSYEEEQASIKAMQDKYPKQWSIYLNERRKNHPTEFFNYSVGETYRKMLNEHFTI